MSMVVPPPPMFAPSLRSDDGDVDEKMRQTRQLADVGGGGIEMSLEADAAVRGEHRRGGRVKSRSFDVNSYYAQQAKAQGSSHRGHYDTTEHDVGTSAIEHDGQSPKTLQPHYYEDTQHGTDPEQAQDGGPVLDAPPSPNSMLQARAHVPMQRRRSSLGTTACSKIGEAAAEHLEGFLATTALERTDSGDHYDHSSQQQPMSAALTAAADLVAPERARTASPTFPGMDDLNLPPSAAPDAAGLVERNMSITSAGSGSRTADGSHGSEGQRCYLPVRTFHMDEIAVGRLLGSGTFNDVYEAYLLPNGLRGRPEYGRQSSLPTLMTADHRRQYMYASPFDEHEQLGAYRPTYGRMMLNDTITTSSSIRRRPSTSPSNCSSSNSNMSGPKFVLKHLKDVVMDDYDTFLTGAVDLAVEAKMLSHLHHPNIIRLEGVTAGSLSDALSTGIVGGYFLVLEKVDITLIDQIGKWAEQKKAAKRRGSGGVLMRGAMRRSNNIANLVKSLSAKSLNSLAEADETPEGGQDSTSGAGSGGEETRRTLRRRGSSKGSSNSFRGGLSDCDEPEGTAPSKEPMFLYHRRLTVAAEIAAGFAYLHRKNILYRDTKPQNIGLDFNGTAKIFDLGLAKELHDGDKRKNTGNCGTKRYMSPEVAKFEHYGLSSDVYSYSLLLWEILALERPYAKLTAKDFPEKVYYGAKRPNIPAKWPEPLRELLPDCWTDKKDERPTMQTVANVLRNMAAEAEPIAHNISSKSLNDGLSDGEVQPQKQKRGSGGGIRPGLNRRSSKNRASFKKLGDSSKSLSSNEGLVIPHNVRKWLDQQESNETQWESETLKAARAGGAKAAARRNSRRASANKESIDKAADEISKGAEEGPAKEAPRPPSNDTASSTVGDDSVAKAEKTKAKAAVLRRPSDQSAASSVSSMLFPARAMSRRASTRHFWGYSYAAAPQNLPSAK